MENDIEKIKKEVDELKKRELDNKINGGVFENILSDIAQFKYEKFYNLMVGIIGIASPTIPIVFLYRRDLMEDNNIIFILVITIIINIIIFVFCVISNRIYKSSRTILNHRSINLRIVISEISIIKSEKASYKLNKKSELMLEKSNNFNEMRTINKVFFKLQLSFIEKSINKFKIKINKRRRNNIKVRNDIEKLRRAAKNKDEDDDFRFVISLNTIIGVLIIFYKAMSYLGMNFINFKYIIRNTMIFYAVIVSRGIITEIISFFIKLLIILCNVKLYKAKNKTELQCEQISMFEEIDREL